MTHKDLDIWKLARELVIDINSMTLNELPKFEMYETGSQIRRSSVSIKANIVEGYSRRKHKLEFLHFLIIAQASTIETLDHLETLFETGALKSREKFDNLSTRLNNLGGKLYKFIRSVSKMHKPIPNF